MSLRRIVSVAAIATSALLVPALPGGATPSTGNCNPYPPAAGQTLTIDASPRVVTATQQVLVFGSFSRGGCPISGATIKIQRKFLVNGAPSGTWTTIATATTTSHGTYAVATHPVRNERLRAHFTGTSGFGTSNSNTVDVLVRTKITESVSKLSGCRLTISGGTTPHKVGRIVRIQNKTATGQHNVATATTNSHGNYSLTKKFVCGKTYHLSAYIFADSINRSGRSGSVTVTPHA